MATLFSRSLRTRSVQRAAQCRRRPQSTFAHLDGELRARKIQPIFDDLTPLRSHRLNVTLSDFVGGDGGGAAAAAVPRLLPSTVGAEAQPLPIPHHLMYFEPTLAARDLLPDGTNPAHSPGHPFTRRMWAGGSVRYNLAAPLLLDGRRALCVEGLRGANVKGRSGEEKVFVGIERRMASLTPDEEAAYLDVEMGGLVAADVEALEDGVRRRLWREDEDDLGECAVLERRSIVFLREDGSASSKAPVDPKAQTTTPPKILKPAREPTFFRRTVLPDARLLFRFSALTFNAHAIHLDPLYCREQEGHRDLLFHGPLSFTLMLVFLQRQLAAANTGEVVSSVEYRNLAPLYCNEEVTFCGAADGLGRYEVWVEGPDGGVKVKGSVRTERIKGAVRKEYPNRFLS